MMRAQLDLVHKVTVTQISGPEGQARSPRKAPRCEGWAADFGAGQLHRLWQLLLKGHDEVKTAPDPLVAAQMALLRALHGRHARSGRPGAQAGRDAGQAPALAAAAAAAQAAEKAPPAPRPRAGAMPPTGIAMDWQAWSSRWRNSRR
jgi:DNA polymerase-3 subunit gamma/tau